MSKSRSRRLLRNFAGAFAAVVCIVALSVGGSAQDQVANSTAKDPRLQKAYRFQQGGWTYVHLEGAPADIGFQHGYLLAPEIADAVRSHQALRHTPNPARLGFLPQDRARNALAPHRLRISAGVAGHRRRRESPRRRSRRLRHRRPQRVRRSSGLLRALAQQTREGHEGSEARRPRAIAARSSPPAATPKTIRSSSRTTTGPATSPASAGSSSSTSCRNTASAFSWTDFPA